MSSDRMGERSDPAIAGPSDAPRHANPQLGPEPWFAYPEPTNEELEQELPPYFEHENVSLGVILDRMTTKGYADLRGLLEEAPRLIINFAKTQRQSFLKYLAILRWKNLVDVPSPATLPEASSSNATFQQVHSIPTPITNGSYGGSTDNSPAAGYIGKGKGRALTSDDDDRKKSVLSQGRVTDAKRVQVLMEHQNRQHEMALHHITAALGQVESLRERNPDLLTAISLLQNGTYTRLPTSITSAFKPVKKLTNRMILRTLRRLNRHLLYRLRCVDHLPPDLIIEAVRDGKVYFGAGGEYGWKAQMTVVGFGEGDDARWWLTGVEWGWKAKGKGTDDPGGSARRLSEEERTQILEIVNNEVLSPRPIGSIDEDKKEETRKIDAPLIRLHNFLQHLSLSYQLETLFAQAIELSQGRWRGQLLVDMDKQTKSLRVRYWIRSRPPQQPQPAGPGQKRNPANNLGAARTPLVGGTLRISLVEATASEADLEELMRGLLTGGSEPSERIINLTLSVKWEVGEGGVGGGHKAGDAMDPSALDIDSASLSLATVLQIATTTHAAHLTRLHTSPLLASPRIALFPLNLPSIIERDSTVTPLSLQIPLPSRQKSSALVVSVSALTGLIEIEDEGATESRMGRARLASAAVNDQKANLLNDLGRLITAVIAETLESQMRQLGWTPTRRLALKSQDLAKNDLHPASSIFVPLPTSSMHYFMAKVGQQGITFELVKLVKVTADNGIGTKLSVGDRTPMDLARMRSRRAERKRTTIDAGVQAAEPVLNSSSFEIDRRDLKDLYIFCNALVAQTIVEQQLKDRSIPHTLQYPPSSGPGAARSASAVAGMIPTICVNVHDLLKDRRASDTAQPKVYIQLKDWWKGEKCKVVTVVQLRHKPTLSSNTGSPTGNEGALAGAAKDEGISFDQASSVVRFEADDISRCVPAFLEQWERLSKVIVVAGEVNRLNKSESFKDMRMISFDLRTATFTYAPGYTASITYTPQDDSYRVLFAAEGVSPHEVMAGLLSHRLNELASGPKSMVKGSTGEQFLGLLCNTLPLLQEVEAIRASVGEFPVLVISSVSDFKLVWDVQNAYRYIVSITLIGDKYLVRDGSTLSDPSCGPFTPIPGWQETLGKAYAALKAGQHAEGQSEQGGKDGQDGQYRSMAMILDEGRSMICGVSSVREVVRVVAEGMKTNLGL